MPQIGEKIAFGGRYKEEKDCPFKEVKLSKEEANKIQSEECSAAKLGKNREAAGETKYKYGEKVKIEFREKIYGKKIYCVQITAHHVIPCGSWAYTKDGKKCANTELWQWIDKDAEDSQVSESVGYDVNNKNNCVCLPSSYFYVGEGWRNNKECTDTDIYKGEAWKDSKEYPENKFPKEKYAFKSMQKTKRQFHTGGHPAYISFVANVLNKIAEKLENNKKDEKCPYCGGKDQKCSFNEKNSPNKKNGTKYAPSQHLKERLDGVSKRLREYLIKKNPMKWKIPIFTSCYALAHKKIIKKKIDTAIEKLKNEKIKQDKLRAP